MQKMMNINVLIVLKIQNMEWEYILSILFVLVSLVMLYYGYSYHQGYHKCKYDFPLCPEYVCSDNSVAKCVV